MPKILKLYHAIFQLLALRKYKLYRVHVLAHTSHGKKRFFWWITDTDHFKRGSTFEAEFRNSFKEILTRLVEI